MRMRPSACKQHKSTMIFLSHCSLELSIIFPRWLLDVIVMHTHIIPPFIAPSERFCHSKTAHVSNNIIAGSKKKIVPDVRPAHMLSSTTNFLLDKLLSMLERDERKNVVIEASYHETHTKAIACITRARWTQTHFSRRTRRETKNNQNPRMFNITALRDQTCGGCMYSLQIVKTSLRPSAQLVVNRHLNINCLLGLLDKDIHNVRTQELTNPEI